MGTGFEFRFVALVDLRSRWQFSGLHFSLGFGIPECFHEPTCIYLHSSSLEWFRAVQEIETTDWAAQAKDRAHGGVTSGNVIGSPRPRQAVAPALCVVCSQTLHKVH